MVHGERPHQVDLQEAERLQPRRSGGAGEQGRPGLTAGGEPRWVGWRLRLLVAAALIGCYALFSLAQELARQPRLDAHWRVDASGSLRLLTSGDAALDAARGQVLVRIEGASDVDAPDGNLLLRSPRWVIDESARLRQQALGRQVSAVLNAKGAPASATLVFEGGMRRPATLRAANLTALGPAFWMFSGLALALYLVTMAVLMAKPTPRNLLYAVIAFCQTGNLLCIAAESAAPLGMGPVVGLAVLPWRIGFDLVTAAAMLNSVSVNPLRMPAWQGIATLGWASAAAIALAAGAGVLGWWWVQGGVFALGLASVAVLAWSHQREPHPSALVLQRFGSMTLVSWGVMTVALALASPLWQLRFATSGTAIFYVFLASLLLMLPFLSRSPQLLREFSLLAATSTLVTAFDLVFAALFSLGQFASLTLALFLALGAYAGARQWLLNRLIGSRVLSTERMFEQLYRIAREVELRPERTPGLLIELLRDVFEPLEAAVIAQGATHAQVQADGSSLLLPLPLLDGGDGAVPGSIRLRYARRGRRLFTTEDARLADRIVEQLRRAVAYDRAVERGRSEERSRLAQDLHDDIGARLLTLMYKAQSPEMEDYIRHTLQDLKTLTRGLAQTDHRLSHAAGEWKADLNQRLTAAHIALGWRFEHDQDLQLSVVQWSALTRVLRELVSNAIAHAQAERVDIDLRLKAGTLSLRVDDDGIGAAPETWSHGLGLGGIRKRVKQLGGDVRWGRVNPHGVRCEVMVPEFTQRD